MKVLPYYPDLKLKPYAKIYAISVNVCCLIFARFLIAYQYRGV